MEGIEMKNHLFGAAVAVLIAGCASAPPKPLTPAQMLLGTWTCDGKIGPAATIKGEMTYVAGGTTIFHINIASGQGGFQIEAAGDGAGSWALTPDDKQLEAKVTSLKIASATLNGKPVSPELVQGMANQMLVGQSTTAAVAITTTTLSLAGTDGANATTCTRPAP
jgi:hypothetical protein